MCKNEAVISPTVFTVQDDAEHCLVFIQTLTALTMCTTHCYRLNIFLIRSSLFFKRSTMFRNAALFPFSGKNKTSAPKLLDPSHRVIEVIGQHR